MNRTSLQKTDPSSIVGGRWKPKRKFRWKLGRAVALKFLPEEIAHGIALGCFEREARAAAAINHPNIYTIHEVSKHDGRAFLAMELLEGQTLKHRIGNKPVPIESLFSWAIQITEGGSRGGACARHRPS